MKLKRRAWTIGLAFVVIGFAGGLFYFARERSRVSRNDPVELANPIQTGPSASTGAIARPPTFSATNAAQIQNPPALRWNVPGQEPAFARFDEWVRIARYRKIFTTAQLKSVFSMSITSSAYAEKWFDVGAWAISCSSMVGILEFE